MSKLIQLVTFLVFLAFTTILSLPISPGTSSFNYNESSATFGSCICSNWSNSSINGTQSSSSCQCYDLLEGVQDQPFCICSDVSIHSVGGNETQSSSNCQCGVLSTDFQYQNQINGSCSCSILYVNGTQDFSSCQCESFFSDSELRNQTPDASNQSQGQNGTDCQCQQNSGITGSKYQSIENIDHSQMARDVQICSCNYGTNNQTQSPCVGSDCDDSLQTSPVINPIYPFVPYPNEPEYPDEPYNPYDPIKPVEPMQPIQPIEPFEPFE